MKPQPQKRLSAETESLGWGTAAAIFALALAVRLIHLWQIQRAPFFALLMGDARVYHAWAMKIAAGDWLGEGVFYQAPLYPYFLGLLCAILKGNLVAVRLFQAVLGAVSCVLLGQAGCRFFSKRVGVVAGLLLALYAPAIFFDTLIQKSVLDSFFVCLVLCLLGELVVGPRRSFWCWLGLAMGCLILTRENALVFVAVILVWLLVHFRALGRERLVFGGFFLLGLGLVLLPVALRNQLVGGEFHLTTSQFGPNFYIGNSEQADGTYRPLRPGRGDARMERQDAATLATQATGRSLTPGEVSRYWTGRAWQDVTSHPGRWLRLLGRKFTLACNDVELADTEDQYTHADWSLPLRVTGYLCRWGVILPLGFLGVWITWPGRRKLWVLHLMAAGYLASLVMFYVFARYRHPLAPFLILFASAGLVGMRGFRQQNAARRMGACLAVTLALALFCNWPMTSKTTFRAMMLINIGSIANEQGRFDDAIRYCQGALKIQPDSFEACQNLGIAYAKLNKLDQAASYYRRALQLAPGYADAQVSLGRVLLSQGKPNEAIEHYHETLRLDPSHAEAHNDLGLALAMQDKLEAAASHYAQAIKLKPDFSEALYNLGVLYNRQGKPTEAVEAYQQALRLNPALAEAHNNLACLLAALGQPAQAETHFREALRCQPNFADALSSYGNLLLQQGRIQEGIARLNEALKSDPNHADAHYNLGEALRAVGDRSGAVSHFRAVLRLKPDQIDALNNLAWLLATDSNPANRDPAEALRLAERACQQTTNQAPASLAALDAAYAGAGRFPEAIEAARKACQLFLSAGETNLVRKAQERLGLYQAGQPYREP